MEYSKEFAQEVLKVFAAAKLRTKKNKEREMKKTATAIKKEIKRKESLMKKSIMEKQPNNLRYPTEEQKKIHELSELTIHSQKGIQKASDEMANAKRKDIFIENTEPVNVIPKRIDAETILEVPLPPGFKKAELELPLPPKPVVSMPDFGKINELIQDNSISIIQCDGSSVEIKINKDGRIEKTDIFLNEQEIKSIIRKFADRIGKEVTQPIFKANLANLEITAISSDFSGNRFVITKK